jgi:hypothetical protein
MPTPTYTLIDSVTLATATTSVTFSSISATGKGDLVLVVDATAASSGIQPYFRINGDSGSNYFQVFMEGDGSTAASGTFALTSMYFSRSIGAIPATGVGRGMIITNVVDYSATDKHKSVLSRHGSTAFGVGAMAGRWASTAAVTSLTMFSNGGGGFDIGSTFNLYQIVSE